jgi:ubiquinone/menaquinone biosynthesis C-methylase UbiE
VEERHLRPVLQQFLGRRVLELACGTGRWSAWLVEKGVRCFAGVDFSRAMLARANRKALLRGRLVLADCHDLPFRNGAFDVVLCSFALGHFQNVQRVAREVARVTVSTGDVIVTDLHPRAYEQGWRTAFRDDLGPVEIATYRRPFDEQLAAWRLAGYRCHHSIAAWLDEREMPIFTQAGKAHIFEEVRHVPAIQILHFKQHST